MRAPVLAVGDGALGFWSALRDVFSETREQRCWSHKIANVLNAPHLVALVRAGARFDKGRLVERPDDQPDHEPGDDAQAA